MTDATSSSVERPGSPRGRWTSFVADPPGDGRKTRSLHEEGNPAHRVRVEHDNHTLLVHLSDEEGSGWTTLAVDRSTREWSIAQRDTQQEAATAAHENLYEQPLCGHTNTADQQG